MNPPSLLRLCGTAALLCVPLIAQTNDRKTLPTERKQFSSERVYHLASKSIVVVNAMNTSTKDSKLGTGVVIKKNVIVSNKHIIENCDLIWISVGNKQWNIDINDILIDPERDLALLTVEDLDLPSIKLNQDLPVIGQKIYAIGNPKGLETTISDGIVSGLRGGKNKDLIQITSPISPGSSGGGLFDEQARLIGITTFYLQEGQNLNFSLPTKWVKDIDKRAIKFEPNIKIVVNKIQPATEKDTPAKIEKTNRFVEYSNNLLRVGNYAELVKLTDEWIKFDSKNSIAHQRAGQARYFLKQLHIALEELNIARKLDPKNAEIVGQCGIIYDELGDSESAMDAFKDALALDRTSSIGKSGLAGIYIRKGIKEFSMGNSVTALEYYQNALRISENEPNAWFQIGFINFNLRKFDVALSAYENCVRLQPKNIDAIFNIGLIHCNLKNQEKAWKSYQELSELDKANADKLFAIYQNVQWPK
ncbi:MAG: trypsin-like peptidase domain-containing protein [Holophagaceae bacterium]|nr:trypsin-like peptidase domain-containing protein [Holophagaceae bacterium]